MLTDSQSKQFTLQDDGQICWQKDASNPLPGVEIARLIKGDAPLQPGFEFLPAELPTGEDKEKAKPALALWLQSHIATVLEPLTALKQQGEMPEPVKEISEALYDAMGIAPRESIQAAITKLDPDMRRVLRNKKVKLGPVLVFLPDLNKPAAVHMRAVLWSLYNGKDLPPPVPADGIVSFKIEESADTLFYRTVGYPVYGPRALRIDMLDRVINAIYDSAQGGKFKAKHEMAEWLGSPIEDLYAVLEAMGHKKLQEPAAEAEKPAEAEAATEEKKPEKPELATFLLKKGRASDKLFERREKPVFAKPDRKKPEKKPFKKKDKKEDRGPRILKAETKSNPEDSPFAILQQLKIKSDGQ